MSREIIIGGAWPCANDSLQIGHPAEPQPDRIISNEYLTLEERRISTSQDWEIRVKDLMEVWGNFVNRSLTFCSEYMEGIVPEGQIDPSLQGKMNILFGKVGRQIEEGSFRDALETIFHSICQANKYFDEKKPWVTRTENLPACRNTIYTCIQLIANLAVALAPFLPLSSQRIADWLQIDLNWGYKIVSGGRQLPPMETLFERLEEEQLVGLLSGKKAE